MGLSSDQIFTLIIIAISVVGGLFLALIIVFGLFIIKRKCDDKYHLNPPNVGEYKQENPTAGGGAENSNLSIHDWITFLSSEKSGLTSVYFTAVAIVVALFGIIISNANHFDPIVYYIILGILLLFLAYMNFLSPIQKRSELAKKILNKIMRSKANDSILIQKEWEDGLNKIYGKDC